MGRIVWDARLKTGHRRIDDQHEELIEAINHLLDAMKLGQGQKELSEGLLALKDATAAHFRMEEGLMDRFTYPGAIRHKAIHYDLLIQLSELLDRYSRGGMVLTSSTLDFLEDWLMKHIQGEDYRFGQFLREQDITD